MDRRLIITFLICAFCASIYAGNGSPLSIYSYYTKADKSACVFPFTYEGKTYNDCTTDGDISTTISWCLLTGDAEGLITYCPDFRNANLTCLDTYTVNGKQYQGCDFIPKTATYKQCQTNNPDLKFRYCVEDHIPPRGKPKILGSGQCNASYLSISKTHTMCVPPSDSAISVPLNATDITNIVAKHNSYRNQVNAKYMFKLYWDDELAKMAQAHSDLCAFEHDLAENRISPLYGWFNGQNLVKTNEIVTSPTTLADAMFSSEKPNFRYNNTCSGDPGSCLHYTQMMLATMTRMGCGQTHCLYPHGIERFLCCNYIHSQYDDTSMAPYEQVNSAAGNICPPSKRDGNLCDCGNKICDFNTQQLDPLTCNCINNQRKRSINKRHAKGSPVRDRHKPFAIPIDKTKHDSNAPLKRDLNSVERHDLVKRNILSKFRKID